MVYVLPRYCAVHTTGNSPPETAQSGGESEEGRRPAPLGRVPATQAWVRGEGRALVACLVRARGPSPRTKQRERTCSQHSALLSKGALGRNGRRAPEGLEGASDAANADPDAEIGVSRLDFGCVEPGFPRVG